MLQSLGRQLFDVIYIKKQSGDCIARCRFVLWLRRSFERIRASGVQHYICV